jgi:hypothetical protein
MTNQEIYDYYKSIPRGTRYRTITDHYNSMTVEERKSYVNYLENLPGRKIPTVLYR